MFKFFKKKPVEEPRKEEEIAISDVYLWLESYELRAKRKIADAVSEKGPKINELADEVRERIDELEKAKLRNENISHRERQFMEGNREAYVRGLRQFIDKVKVTEKDYSIARDYKELSEEMSKQTARAYTVLQNYLANESSKINKAMKKLLTELESLSGVLKEYDVESLPAVKEEIAGLFSRIQDHERLRKKLIKKQNTYSEWEQKLQAISDQKESLEDSEEYKDLEYIKGLRDEVSGKIEKLEASLRDSFSSISAALKKFVRIQFKDEIVTRDYLANPVSAIKRDFTLKIVGILQQLKSAVETGQIELKPAKRQKVISHLDKMDEAFFKDFLASYNDLFKRKMELDKSIEKNKTHKKLESLDSEIRKFKDDLASLDSEIKETEAQLEKLQIEEYKQKIEQRLSDITDVNLTLVG